MLREEIREREKKSGRERRGKGARVFDLFLL
jgi:hypothetical protein